MALRGVNLGGWLVLEPWLTPSLFRDTNAVDEYTFCKLPDARKKLTKFRGEFITEADFAWLAGHHIEAVRLPVGYWVFGDSEPYVGALQYVDRAFAWAQKYGLRVLLDLHAAPGSQNGEMHSGQRGSINWPQAKNVAQTLEVLQRLAERYGRHPSLLGISFLNEPSPSIPALAMRQFYEQAYKLLKPLVADGVWLIFSDTFRPWRWFWRLPRRKFPGLYVEYHHYQIFSTLDKRLSVPIQLWRARHTMPGKLRRMGHYHPVIIGEWSAALRSEKMTAVPATQRQALQRSYVQAQQQLFDHSAAWFYWTYKTENGGAWSFRDQIEEGTIE